MWLVIDCSIRLLMQSSISNLEPLLLKNRVHMTFISRSFDKVEVERNFGWKKQQQNDHDLQFDKMIYPFWSTLRKYEAKEKSLTLSKGINWSFIYSFKTFFWNGNLQILFIVNAMVSKRCFCNLKSLYFVQLEKFSHLIRG